MARRSPLDDPRTAAHAWARYRRLMKGIAALALGVVAATLGGFYWYHGFLSLHFFVAVTLGLGVTILLTGGLMGLLFLSSGTGHDESVADPGAADQDADPPGSGRRR